VRQIATAARLKRLIRTCALALAALGAMTAQPAAGAQPRRIIAVGDLHGDYGAWLDIARAAGLINPGGRWAAGSTILVQLGDIVDREPDSLRIIRSLQQLQKEAPRSGGKVIVVLGNHEAMNLLGDFRYTTAGEFAAFEGGDSAALRDRAYEQNRVAIETRARAANPVATPQQIRSAWLAAHPLGWIEHKIAWSPSGELGRWATRNPAVVKIGGTLFVHGGLSQEYSRMPLEKVNRLVSRAMAAANDAPNSPLNDPLSPIWYRGLVGRDPDAQAARAKLPGTPPTPEEELATALSAYGAKRMVIGHTPNLQGIEILYGAGLARIDTGISRYYGGPLTWLEIVGDRMIPHSVARSGR
jgi:hypothetical protein